MLMNGNQRELVVDATEWAIDTRCFAMFPNGRQVMRGEIFTCTEILSYQRQPAMGKEINRLASALEDFENTVDPHKFPKFGVHGKP
jgi:hypothetical protein